VLILDITFSFKIDDANLEHRMHYSKLFETARLAKVISLVSPENLFIFANKSHCCPLKIAKRSLK
jgi:hypothetical protein